MAKPTPTARPRARYRVVCYELVGERSDLIMDDTGEGFIVATGTITDGIMSGELVSAGPHELQAHLALTVAHDDQLSRPRHDRPTRPR